MSFDFTFISRDKVPVTAVAVNLFITVQKPSSGILYILVLNWMLEIRMEQKTTVGVYITNLISHKKISIY